MARMANDRDGALVRQDLLAKAGWLAERCVGAAMFECGIPFHDAERLEIRRLYCVLSRWALARLRQERGFSGVELAQAQVRYWERRVESVTAHLKRSLLTGPKEGPVNQRARTLVA